MASSYASSVVLVDILAPANGQKNFVYQNIDRSSSLSHAFLLPKNVDIPDAAKVAGFMDDADLMSPLPVSISLLGDNPTMRDAVELYRVACLDYEFRKSLVSDDIRDFVRQQSYESIPTLSSFKLIVDRMSFDKGVVFNIMDRVESTKIAKTLDPLVYEAIVKYAKKTGWANCLEEAERKVKEKMAKANKGRKQAARMGKGKQGGGQGKKTRVEPFTERPGDFPALGRST